MEVMFFRSAYAEAWSIAFLPLLFKYARRLARGERAAVPMAASAALMFLSHVPCAIIGTGMAGLYLLIMKWRALWRYALGVSWGALIAAFYLVPAFYYLRFVDSAHMNNPEHAWPNRHLSIDNILIFNQWSVIVTIAIAVAFFLIVSALVNSRRAKITDHFVQREITAWNILFAAALILLTPISTWIYDLVRPISQAVFPWRMQIIFCLSTVYLAAALMQWLASDRQMKTWKADYAMLILALFFISGPTISVRHPDFETYRDKILTIKWMTQPEYRPHWIEPDYFNYRSIMMRAQKRPPLINIIRGSGTAQMESWGWRGIRIKTDSRVPITVKLDHLYFPVWQAINENGGTVDIHPENKTGLITFDLPAGQHRTTLSYSAANANPSLMRAADTASLIGMLGLFACFYRRNPSVSAA